MSPLWIVLTLLPVLGGAERFNCRGRILGAYYADAKSGCKAFHVCVRVAGGGIRDFRFFCPPGTLFHQEAQTCTDWGDDDPLACPADIYDGQFDLYKIGSGYDTKKVSSPGNRDDEAEFSLQRAETGDRRLSQNSASNGPASDLRAAHSSDFFSGQRERGRDDSFVNTPSTSSRQSFRRATTPRTTSPPTQYTTIPPSPPPQSSNPQQYDGLSKRKFIRKRPVHSSTPSPPSTFAQNNTPRQQYFPEQPQQNFDRRIPQIKQTPTAPPNVPPQYKDEYVEVSKVTSKQNNFFPNSPSPAPFSQSTAAPQFHKKDGLVELYNYEAQSTPGLNVQQNENKPFKVRNSFNVSPDVPKELDFARTNVNNNRNSNGDRGTPSTNNYNTAPARNFVTSTPSYRNVNSVSYEPEKNNFVQFSGAKQNYFNNPTTTPSTTTFYTTIRSDPPANLNTVAYNTNIGFNAHPSKYAETDEDDGQYRPPRGEDDGQYRPELYERELLAGAHSLNIAASGNRLPEDQKPRAKTQPPPKPVSQTAAPRPFRPAPTPSSLPAQTSRASESTYTTTVRPQTVNTQRTFDYYQTYTTTSRPTDPPGSAQETYNSAPINNIPVNPTTLPPRSHEPRPQSRPSVPSTPAPAPPSRPTTRPPHFTKPVSKKDDASYDYAYYDSDPGFSEYDHIEEFGKTKTRA